MYVANATVLAQAMKEVNDFGKCDKICKLTIKVVSNNLKTSFFHFKNPIVVSAWSLIAGNEQATSLTNAQPTLAN